MLHESSETAVGSGRRPVFTFAILQPPAAAIEAVPDTEDVRRRISIASSRRKGRKDEGVRLVRGWLGTRVYRGVVAGRRTCLLQPPAPGSINSRFVPAIFFTDAHPFYGNERPALTHPVEDRP